MKLYLMRHAHSEEGDRMDDSRGVTDIGFEQIAVMRKFLKKANVKPEVILSSKFQRAVETAEGVQRKDTPIKFSSALDPVEHDVDVNVANAWKAILSLDVKTALVVTHGPLIQPLLASICFEFVPELIRWEHCSVAYINTTDPEHRFRWFATPKLAAHIVGYKDPKAVESPAEVELAAALIEALELSENLGLPSRRVIIDPLIAKVRKALRIRWMTQLKKLEIHGLPLLQEALLHVQTLAPRGIRTPDHDKRLALATIPLHHAGFAVKFKSATKDAYAHGALKVQDQLPAPVQEAAKPKAPPHLPGPARDPEDVEDELDGTTSDRVSTIIDRAFGSPLTYAAMVGLIRDEFQNWGKAEDGETSRAETVALQEVSTAYHDGGRDFVDDWRGGNGPVEKRWNAEDDACEICLENEAEDFIDSEAPHSSGEGEPPAHPNCRCEEEYRAIAVEESLR